ncbi:MAG: hypothetical protein U0136_07730 [Bdellovibrionota bacterium]
MAVAFAAGASLGMFQERSFVELAAGYGVKFTAPIFNRMSHIAAQ